MSFILNAQLTLHGSLEAGEGRVHPDGVFAGGGLRSIVELGDCAAVEHQLCVCAHACIQRKKEREEARKQKRESF